MTLRRSEQNLPTLSITRYVCYAFSEEEQELLNLLDKCKGEFIDRSEDLVAHSIDLTEVKLTFPPAKLLQTANSSLKVQYQPINDTAAHAAEPLVFHSKAVFNGADQGKHFGGLGLGLGSAS